MVGTRQFERAILEMGLFAAHRRKLEANILGMLVAAGTVGAAFLVRWMVIGEASALFPLVMLYPAVVISAVVGGYRAGIFATALSLVYVLVSIAPITGRMDVIRIVSFLVNSFLIIAICEVMHRAQARVGEARANSAHAHTALENEQRLQWALQASGGSTWDWDPQSDEMWWSPEMYALWGAEPGSILRAEQMFALVNEKDRQAFKDAVHASIAQQSSFRCEFRILHGERGERWMLSTGRRTFDEGGKSGRMVGLTFDITERKQVYLALAESEHRFRATFDNVAVGIAHLAPDGSWISVNDRFCQIMGYPAEELLKSKFQQLTHPDDLGAQQVLSNHILTGVIDRYSIEKRYVRKGGSTVWVNLTVSCVRRESGEVEYFISVIEDISERRAAEGALRESEARLRAIVDTAVDAIVVIHDDGRIQSVNPATDRIFGYAENELVGQKITTLVPEREATGSLTESLFTQAEAVGNRGFGRDGRRKDGRAFPIDLTVAAWRDARGRPSFTCVMRDATERKQGEEELARKRRMEVIGQLAGGVAHDFNNLLAIIIGNLELAEPRIDQADARKMIRKALEAAETGASFNQRLLSLARKRRLEPERIDLNRWVSGTIMLLERTLDANITLTAELADDLWPTRADAGEVESAVLNLALNARDAMPQGGELVIRTRNITLDETNRKLDSEARPGDFVLLCVMDTGHGMAPEILARAFEPFFTAKESGKGTGLGLVSVSNFARQSEGFIELESEVDKGTTFSIYLPRAPEQEPSSNPAPPDNGVEMTAKGELILVVEDDDRVRDVTSKRLENLGYIVREARSAVEAIEWLESKAPIKLVFSDILMPGSMTGRDLAQWMGANRPAVKMLLTSGYDDGDKRRSNSRLKVLPKPYSTAELAKHIRKLLDS
ncbi:PAS domain S-box protein [Mesorhizobium sp. A556]